MPPPQQAPQEGQQQQSKITGIVRSVAMFFAVQMGQSAYSAISVPPTDNALTSRLFSYEVWHVLCMFISLPGYVPWTRMYSGLPRMTAWHRSTKRSCKTAHNWQHRVSAHRPSYPVRRHASRATRLGARHPSIYGALYQHFPHWSRYRSFAPYCPMGRSHLRRLER